MPGHCVIRIKATQHGSNPSTQEPEGMGHHNRLFLILAGDWNLVLDPSIDYCNYKCTNNVKAQEKVEEIIADQHLVDIWRELNPQLQQISSTGCSVA